MSHCSIVPLPIAQAIDFAMQIAEGLALAHEKGIVHRDVKSANIMITDKGQVTIGQSTDGYYEGYRTHYRWDVGLCVRDWRYAVRYAFNLEDLLASCATGNVLHEYMVRMQEVIPSLTNCKPVYYMNRQVLSMLRQQMNTKAAYNLSFETLGGKHVSVFNGIPVRRSDALLSTEGTTLGDSPVA